MFHFLDDLVSIDLCDSSATELLNISSSLEGEGRTLEPFRLRGRPCEPKKLRLTERNDRYWGGPRHAAYGKPSLWADSDLFDRAPITRSLVSSLPLEAYGRVLAIVTPPGAQTPEHTDHNCVDMVQEFVWIRLSITKQFHLSVDGKRCELPAECRAVWFDTRLLHGSAASEFPSVSLRVDGRFRPSLTEKLAKESTRSKMETCRIDGDN